MDWLKYGIIFIPLLFILWIILAGRKEAKRLSEK